MSRKHTETEFSRELGWTIFNVVRGPNHTMHAKKYLDSMVQRWALSQDQQISYVIRKALYTNFVHLEHTALPIGPLLAQFLLLYRSCMHHIASQFAFDSPEFDQYRAVLSAACEHWQARSKSPKHDIIALLANKIRVNLICAAYNRDERVFGYVYNALNSCALIDCLKGMCTINNMQCVAGLTHLRDTIARIESRA